MLDETRNVRELFGIGTLGPRRARLVLMPTTAGTGSEVSPNAILLDEERQAKLAVISPHLVPDASFVDPALARDLPAAMTAATGIDALTHCIEAYANKRAHPMVDDWALAGIRLIAGHLERACRDGHDLAARGALALGSLYGGMCLGPVNTAAVHALAYPLGGMFHVGHGLGNALMLPAVLRCNLPAAPARYAAIAVALGAASPSEARFNPTGAGARRNRCARGAVARLRAAGRARRDRHPTRCDSASHRFGVDGSPSPRQQSARPDARRRHRHLRSRVRVIAVSRVLSSGDRLPSGTDCRPTVLEI